MNLYNTMFFIFCPLKCFKVYKQIMSDKAILSKVFFFFTSIVLPNIVLWILFTAQTLLYNATVIASKIGNKIEKQ